jgi:hypothetical protein
MLLESWLVQPFVLSHTSVLTYWICLYPESSPFIAVQVERWFETNGYPSIAQALAAHPISGRALLSPGATPHNLMVYLHLASQDELAAALDRLKQFWSSKD